MTMQLTTRQGFAPTTFTEARQFAEELASSSLVPKAYTGKPLDVLVAMQWGAEIGLAPMQALQNIAVINGKPSVYGDAAMALVQASPSCEGVEEFFEGTEGTGNYTAVCIAHRKDRKPVTARFSIEDARRAGLWGKQGPWTQYPKRMLQMRARGFALRDAFPDALKGLITVEEAQDFPDEAKPRPPKDVTPLPANPLDMIPPPAPLPTEDEYVPDLDEINAELQNAAAESAEPVAEPAVPEGLLLLVPGKGEDSEPRILSGHNSQQEWSDAYEAIAEKTLTAGKAPERQRMTALRQLKEVNKDTIDKLDLVAKTKHTEHYQRRLKILGATMNDKEKNPGE
jgi:hypothetical protein